MLKVRVLTAAVLTPLFALGVVKLPGPYFSVLVGAVVLLGAWEWIGLSGYRTGRLKFAAVAGTALLMVAAYAWREPVAEPLLLAAAAAWLAVAALLARRRNGPLLSWPEPVRLVSGLWVLVPAWLGVCLLQGDAPVAALLLLLLVWAADTGAYFAGRRWGRRRLAPAISPGKTLEGVVGAAVAAALVAGVFAFGLALGAGAAAGLVLWSVVVVLISVFGDLFESNWKRQARIKDSGGLLPGHGGVLDRIDSMTAASPFFALGWMWWFGHASA